MYKPSNSSDGDAMVKTQLKAAAPQPYSVILQAFRLYSTVAVVGALVGRATVYGILFPFVPALAAALAPAAPTAAAVAAVVGLFSLAGTWGASHALQTAATLALWAAGLAVSRGGVQGGRANLWLMGFASLVASAALAAVHADGPEGYWLAALQAVFTVAMAAAMAPAFRGLTLAGQSATAEAAPGASSPASRGALSGADIVPAARLGAVVLVGSLVAGLDGLTVAGLAPATVLGALLVALVASVAGGGTAAAAGALFAAVASLSRGIAVTDMGVYAFAAALAGILRGLGPAGVVAGTLLGFLGAIYNTASAEVLTATLASAFLGSLVAVGVPRRWWRQLASAVGLAAVLKSETRATAQNVSGQPVSAQASRRLKAIARLLDELSRAFQEPAPTAASTENAGPRPAAAAESDLAAGLTSREELTELAEAVAARVCQGCDLQQTCWQPEFHRTHRNLADAWAVAEARGGITPGRLPEDFRKQCIHVPDMAAAINQVQDLVRLSRYWERRTAEGRSLVTAQLTGVAQIMDGLADAVLHEPGDASGGPGRGGAAAMGTGMAARRAPRLAYQIGISRASKGGSPVSGDALLHRQLDGDRLLLALSDGMGAGPRAAQESRVTIDLIERLLEAGFAPDVAVHTVNSILLLRSAEETFATLDLLLLQLASGQATFIKTGAAPSFVRRRGQVSVVKSASLPAGILTQIEVPLTQYQLQAGDLLVMVTDGLLTDLGEGGVIDFLQRFPRQEPQLVAEALLSRALAGAAGQPPDDITVCAVLLTQTENPTQANDGWVPVRWRPIAPARRNSGA